MSIAETTLLLVSAFVCLLMVAGFIVAAIVKSER